MEDLTLLDLIYELRKKCLQIDESLFDSFDISQAEYNMFICLKNCKHFNSYSVAEKMNLSLSRVSRIIDKMVGKEFLTRTTNKLDRRAIDIKLTPKGKEIMTKIDEYRLERCTKINTQINNAEAEQIATSLQKLIEIL
jgi:DNA-binding MarR family transcriptional regulator